MNDTVSCDNATTVEEGKTVVGSVVLFVAGVVGNVIALGILYKHKRQSKRTSVFYVLVTGLVGTDLSGKCLISPVVFASYARNLTLKALSQDHDLCAYSSISMSFFGLCSTALLLTMALECWLSISHPFFYQEHITKRRVVMVFPVVYASCLLFSLLPVLVMGSYKQYCPGTWCFIHMTPEKESARFYSVLYATLLGVLIVAVLVCNLSVGVNLAKMFRRQRRRSTTTLSFGAGHKHLAHSEELDHLVLLVLMTVLFVVCSAPLTGRKT
ncbi:prostaglandin D2 receptor isoform X2 [Callorhinchus milii]|uniref:prostaglandin D2 receptor isoform X2 n=1 Tax=Callorhinchus milii TaxID=7868 RepID=UPI001C3FD789|nr:prostaglandin D2 receptor isoform X2 [Callorhinchus milii]